VTGLPGKRRPAGAGRSAACRPCNGSEGTTDKCVCLLHCGHEMCTGAPSDVHPDSWPTRWADDKRRQGNNPQGLGGPTRKGVRKDPPKYDGPR
jgi:hypothetical protein